MNTIKLFLVTSGVAMLRIMQQRVCQNVWRADNSAFDQDLRVTSTP